jgi:AraC family transcriptional regulator
VRINFMPAQANVLPYGQYIGSSQRRHEVPGFSVSLLTPALRAEDVPLHTHENASFVLVLSGAYISSAQGAEFVSASPMLIFNPAGTVHRDSFALAEGRFLAVSISDQSLRAALDYGVLPGTASVRSSREAVDTAICLARECSISGPVTSSSMEAICWEMVSEVSGVNLGQGNTPPSWVGKAQEILREPSSNCLNIAEIAQRLGVHPVYFARAFRKVFRCTPGEYRMRCRLRDALQLVRGSSRPLSEIALASGFYDQSHFSTAFREHFGMPPQAYRKRLPGDEVQLVQERT